MAKRGSSKRKSVEQEQAVARAYHGVPSPSSGASDTDAGDVRAFTTLIECKATGGPGLEKQPTWPSFKKILRWLEGVALEAWEEGRDPAVCIRVYDPDSRFAVDGWVDVTIRPMGTDATRDISYAQALEEFGYEIH